MESDSDSSSSEEEDILLALVAMEPRPVPQLPPPERPLVPVQRLDYLNLDPGRFRLEFRFEKRDFPNILENLRMPDTLLTENRIRVTSADALLIVMKRLATPKRYVDFFAFGRPKEAISRIFSTTINWLENRWGPLLNFRAPPLEKLRDFSNAFLNKGCPLGNMFAVFDGTLRPTCRPKYLL
eukprot:Pompholyxophrys_punicea_v1_NODE_81_length_3705_cov_14.177534.p1 type:complete len:182 gc:universal NODE_81_length_3705_cov_14.177534:3326-2781(-)